ncbi:hypothetical protein BFS06_11705 [Clostridium perfringens]|uniref:DNA primase n=1 Tax=Clostridium perfringens TaxID=1502 RepID=A0A140GS50_CLOPF|nr:CHC2 zinc finger domain-containing protein [Clostridium perfringens]AMN31359.1 DNA primase [Clostridium perfringens]TBX14878.1 hypothetical protein BFS06_11705 [Clostridium perfringens]
MDLNFKKEFVSKLSQQILENVNIIDVASKYLNLKYSHGNYLSLCPFHNDNRLGSFSISPSKNICKCFSCGEGGNAIALYKHIKGYCKYYDAIVNMGLDFGLINQSTYDEYYSDDFNIKRVKIKKIEKKVTPYREEVDRQDEVIIDLVYRALKYICGLKEEHKAYLMNRGLSEDETSEYFSIPSEDIVDKLVFEISKYKKDFSVSNLKGIPGFYYDTNLNKWCNSKSKGIGICIKNAFGIIEGIQIRRDKVEENQTRYIWFSSSFAYKYEGLDMGRTAKIAVDVVYPKKIKLPTVFITEGRFKARAIAEEFGVIALSVQGVGNWIYLKDTILDIEKNSKLTNKLYVGKGDFKIKHLMMAFDADMAYNIQVTKQLLNVIDKLEDLNIDMKIAIWDEHFGKGIDDMIEAGHRDMLESMDYEEFSKQANIVIQQAFKQSNARTAKDVPKELVYELYLKCILSKCKKYKNI